MTAKSERQIMRRPRRVDEHIAHLLGALTLRARSLIVTVYGDAIMPHGGSAWLGSLIKLVEPLGLSDRVVRTSVFRLAKDDWLTGTQIGRRSYYAFTESGRHRTEAAHRRLYGPVHRAWNGEWCIVSTGTADLATDRREALRRELTFMGFGTMAPTVLAHPSPDYEGLRELLQDMGLAESVVVMRSTSLSPAAPVRKLVQTCWDLDKLSAAYAAFLDHFRPFWRLLEGEEELDPESCFVIRILLMHEFRRLLLRDPMLPDELLPADWSGTASRVLCRNLYRLVRDPAEQHLMRVLETAEGPIPEASPSLYARFGGLSEPLPRAEAS